MATTILLRTLTSKSLLKFGKYSNETVGHLLKLQKINYLLWVYYCNSQINFNDELLLELDISLNERIEKPGKISFEDCGKYILKRAEKVNLKHRDIKSINTKPSEKQIFDQKKIILKTKWRGDVMSKEALTRYNHGHK